MKDEDVNVKEFNNDKKQIFDAKDSKIYFDDMDKNDKKSREKEIND